MRKVWLNQRASDPKPKSMYVPAQAQGLKDLSNVSVLGPCTIAVSSEVHSTLQEGKPLKIILSFNIIAELIIDTSEFSISTTRNCSERDQQIEGHNFENITV